MQESGGAAASSGDDDVKLDTEELISNWQQRVDEVVALESIHGEDFRIQGLTTLDSPDLTAEALADMPPPEEPTHICCAISIHVDVPDSGLQVCLDMPSNTSTSDTSITTVPIGGRVKFLTPIQLNLELPPGYPSHRMPVFKLTCSWMSEVQVGRVVQQLEELWAAEGRGLTFCYAWIDWLQSQLLQHLGVEDRLLLGADLVAGTHRDKSDHSSGSGSSTNQQRQCIQHMEEVALSIVRYHGMREQAKFDQGSWLCCICFEYTLGTKCVKLTDCGHFFCRDCISQHCKVKVKDGDVDDITCPIPDCRLSITPYVLRQLLSQEEFERWEELLLNRTLDRMQDVVYCPRCNTSSVEDKDHCAQCPRCYFAFCSLCHAAWHPGEQCVDPSTRLRIMEERCKGNRKDADKMAAEHLDLMNQVKSLKLVRESARSCPSCQMAIQKSEGCNKMVCSYCNTKFCYKCLKIISGYEHFGENSCELFPEAEINRWNAMMDGGWQLAEERREHMENGQARVEVAQILGQRFVNRLANCPVCGQANLKMNNNNAMRCWACGCAFCYQCRTYIRAKVSMHFKPKGQCSQHSAD